MSRSSGFDSGVPGDAEVEQLGGLLGRVVHDVGGLEIAVDDAGVVSGRERRADLLDDLGDEGRGQVDRSD